MNSWVRGYRRIRQQLSYLHGYIDLNVDGAYVKRRTDFTNCQRPLLLLYGFFSTRQTLGVLERRLRRDGYCVFSLNLGGFRGAFNTRSIDDLADFVRAKIERLYARYPGMGPLTIVGHSKGGLIGTYYVKKLGGHRRTRVLVTLGTPHNGTPVAYFGLPISLLAHSLLQMTPVSPFVRRLQQAPWPDGPRVTSIYSRFDRLNPFPSGLIETGGMAHLRNVEVECSHREFLLKKKVYDIILREIVGTEVPAATRLQLVPKVG
jgi:triacylglycerol lipase